ncbi:arginine deiminase type-3 [Pochonia chlamydosporia 170]|uniref:Arginine deiminase type-3 n=1 Tax=Pochonia chlamydosporia 170 TaxID=1380566 RepID=A0A179FCH6_METCM|nr:arginine deiminase type-3 [Pochonia chlamydosporia 170]OAQ62763.1 arginine deiminase type-3 [Pochonia chlamydosporia 170]
MHVAIAVALALPLVGALPQRAPNEIRQENSAPFKADLRVDTNRDGRVDVDGSTDVNGKDAWSETSGAIFLPNIGSADRHCSKGYNNADCNDASTNEQWAPKFMAIMRTVPIANLSDSAVGTISIQDPKARAKVRIFLDSPEMVDNPPSIDFGDLTDLKPHPPVESLRHVYMENDTPIPAAKLRNGLTLGIDGRDTRRPDWDGKVTVEFKVTDGSSSSTDKVMLRVAPVLTHHHLQPVEKVFTTKKSFDGKLAEEQEALIKPIEDGIQRNMQKAGIKQPLEHLNIQYTWAQDVMEPGYASMPGPEGPITMRINVYGVPVTDNRGGDLVEKLIFTDLRQDGVSAFRPAPSTAIRHGTLEAGGNIESIPPYELNGKKYPAGRIVIGGTDAQKPEALSYFKAQEAQDPILLDSTWLYVKHVDEMVGFLPAKTERSWRIVIVDPMMGYDALAKLDKEGHGDVKLTSNPKAQNETGLPTVREFLADPQTREAATHSTKIMEQNLQTLKKETGVTDADIVRVPAVIASMSALKKYLHARDPYGSNNNGNDLLPLNSAFPSQVNGVPLSDSVFIAPKPWGPVVNNEDVIQKLTAEAYSKAGFEVDFIDEWDLHLASGDLHCFTNTYRSMSAKWW